MAYESPITLFTEEVENKLTEELTEKLDATVFKAVWKCFPYVDRDELLKALEYDRGQYEKGYADGHAARDAEIVRCKDCIAERYDLRRLVLCRRRTESEERLLRRERSL